MINPKNLMLNNWLMVGNPAIDDEPAYQQVAYVGETIGLHIDREQGTTQKFQHNPIFSRDINDLHGIPLTPEILEACGFETDKITYWYEYTLRGGQVLYLVLGFYKGERFFYLPTSDIKIRGVHVQHLHQVQNLYLALTGQELEVKLPASA